MPFQESARKDRLSEASEINEGNDDPLHGTTAYLRQLGIRTVADLYAAAERQMHTLRVVPSSPRRLSDGPRHRLGRTATAPAPAELSTRPPAPVPASAGSPRKRRQPLLRNQIKAALGTLREQGVDPNKTDRAQLMKLVPQAMGIERAISTSTFGRALREFKPHEILPAGPSPGPGRKSVLLRKEASRSFEGQTRSRITRTSHVTRIRSGLDSTEQA